MEKRNFSMEVYEHFGLDLLQMRDEKMEHDWGICKKEDAQKCTRDMLGFGMDENQQIIIDYDKEYDWVLVRRYRKEYGASHDAPQRVSKASVPVPKDMG